MCPGQLMRMRTSTDFFLPCGATLFYLGEKNDHSKLRYHHPIELVSLVGSRYMYSFMKENLIIMKTLQSTKGN